MVLFVTGDLMLGRGVKRALDNHGLNKLLFPLKNYIGTGSIIANLESPLTLYDKKKSVTNSPSFKSDPQLTKILKENEFIGFNLANNHSFDYGLKGFTDTINNLNENNIFSFGAGKNREEAYKNKVITIDGLKISCLGLSYRSIASINTPGVADLYDKELLNFVKNHKLNSDYLFIFAHTGVEFLDFPLPRDQKLYRELIDAGADIVIGGHPHCVQVKEKYKDKWIYYSLGDLIFDHADNEVWKKFRSKNSNSFKYSPNVTREKPHYSLTLKIEFKKNYKINIEEILLKIPNNKEKPCGVPVLGDEKDFWYQQYNILNQQFLIDKNLRKSLKNIEEEILCSIKGRKTNCMDL